MITTTNLAPSVQTIGGDFFAGLGTPLKMKIAAVIVGLFIARLA
jgi:hypothetical protein